MSKRLGPSSFHIETATSPKVLAAARNQQLVLMSITGKKKNVIVNVVQICSIHESQESKSKEVLLQLNEWDLFTNTHTQQSPLDITAALRCLTVWHSVSGRMWSVSHNL